MSRKLDDEDRLLDKLSEKDPRPAREDRERRSWRELDRLRDRSAHSKADPSEKKGKSPKSRFHEEQLRKGSLATAENLFSNPARETLEKKLLSVSADAMDALLQQYIEEYGFPSSFEVLSRLVDHPSGEIVQTALEQIQIQWPNTSEDKRASLLQSLKLVAMMGRDAKARKSAKRFLRTNSS